MAVMPYNPLPTPTLALVLWALTHPVDGDEWMHGGDVFYRTGVIRPTTYSILARLYRNGWVDRNVGPRTTLYRLRSEYREQALKLARAPAPARAPARDEPWRKPARDYGDLLRELVTANREKPKRRRNSG